MHVKYATRAVMMMPMPAAAVPTCNEMMFPIVAVLLRTKDSGEMARTFNCLSLVEAAEQFTVDSEQLR